MRSKFWYVWMEVVKVGLLFIAAYLTAQLLRLAYYLGLGLIELLAG